MRLKVGKAPCFRAMNGQHQALQMLLEEKTPSAQIEQLRSLQRRSQ